MDWYHYCSTCIFFVQVVDNLGAEYYCMDLQGQVIIYSQTSIKRPSIEQSPSMKWSPIKFPQFVFHIYCEIFDLCWAVTLPLVPEVIFLLSNSW